MVKNTGSWALKEEEIELDLGLSVGGSYSRQNVAGLKSDSSIDPISELKNPDCLRSSISYSFDATEENNQMTKKEIHALRRQEAKKKREEKQLKRAFSKANFNGGQIKGENQNGCQNDGILHVNASQNHGRECKKMKKGENGSDQINDMNNKIGPCYATPCNPSSAQYGTTPENGFMYPCANVMPCWFAGGAAATTTTTTEEKHMVQELPVVGYGFVPVDPDHGSGNGYGSEEICSGGERGSRKSGSNGSNNGTSTCSGHRSSCNEGGGSNSSYTRSNSSPVPRQPQIQSNGSKPNDTKSHSDHTAISNFSESVSVNEATTTTTNSTPTGIKPNKSGHENKPPKPVYHDQTTPTPLPYMPCVSTTGNGPNGKTVNGFLYRYTKTEVSIICVCHGTSFSPAEFIQHAGGTDVLHPLKHITVIPSAF